MAERRDTRLRFEQWARNPSCLSNTISAVHGVSMGDVVKREGGAPTMGQSPFALARGYTFERALFRNEAEVLREALRNAGVLPESANGFRDFRLRQNGGPFGTLDEALTATAALLKDIAAAGATRRSPSLVAGAVVRIPGGVMLPQAILVIDVLTVTRPQKRPVLTVGEIKTYPDRGGYTDGAELSTARAQAGVYVHGLRLVLEELGLTGLIDVSTVGFLVLSRPGFNRPSIRANEDLRYQAGRAARGFAHLREVAATLPSETEASAVIDAILQASVAYGEACVSFCDRAATCHRRALEQGDATALGEDVARFLGETNLYRALELLEGAPPQNAAEEDLARRMAEARRN
jgi:hypothetical protein